MKSNNQETNQIKNSTRDALIKKKLIHRTKANQTGNYGYRTGCNCYF